MRCPIKTKLPRLVREIPSSAHFLFYDNPIDTFQAIGAFVQAAAAVRVE